MLTRLYVDNYRCLNNFDLPLRELTLLLGSNGSGKSMILHVLSVIRRVLHGGPIKWLTADTMTRWLRSTRQVFEVTVQGPQGTFEYRLIIEHGVKPRARVAEEHLLVAQKPLLRFESGRVSMSDDDQRPRPAFQLPEDQSALGTVVTGEADQQLVWFRDYMRAMVLLRLEPSRKNEDASKESDHLGLRGQNFASWYRHLSVTKPDQLAGLREHIKSVLPGLHSLQVSGKESPTLRAGFMEDGGPPYEFKFTELSDGQRALIMLHTLVHVLRETTLFIDEPENYVALPELQPWLVELREATQRGDFQALLISHHPELIDYLAPEAGVGVWLERSPNGPTRVREPPGDDGSGLLLSQRIARGWIP